MPSRLLLIETDRSRTSPVAAAIANAGYPVESIGLSDDLAACLVASAPDLIVVDLAGPSIAGLVALTRVRRLGPRIPLIALGLDTSWKTAADAMRRGASDYLPRECVDDLPVAIARILGERGRAERSDPLAATSVDLPEWRDTDQLLQAVVASVPLAVMGIDQSGIVTLWNPGAEQLFGWSAAEALGRFLPTVPADRREEFLANLQSVGDGKIFAGIETRRQRQDGTLLDVSIYAAPIRDAAGQIVGNISFVTDVTARKQAEQEQRFLADVARVFAEAHLDLDVLLKAVCQSVIDAFGGQIVVELIDADGATLSPAAIGHPDELARAWIEAAARSQPGRVGEGSIGTAVAVGAPRLLRRADPAISPDDQNILAALEAAELAIVPMRAGGRPLGAILVAHAAPGAASSTRDLVLLQELADRTALAVENVQLFRRVEAAVNLRDEFLSVAAHELKTPMTSIRAGTQLLLRRLDREVVPDPALLRRSLQILDQQSDRLSRLVTQLLDVSRIEGGKLSLEPTSTDLVALARGVVTGAESRTESHPISLSAPESLVSWVDPIRLEQVLTNLLDNAIKFSPSGGPIEIEVRPEPVDQVYLAVTDHGISIAPEHRARIFDRFYQAHEGSHLSGLGLGLFISHQIVELHAGTLDAQFPEDGGCRFVIRLPAGANPPIRAS